MKVVIKKVNLNKILSNIHSRTFSYCSSKNNYGNSETTWTSNAP